MAEPKAPPAPEDAQVRRGVGSGDQLAQGEATELNAALEAIPSQDQTGLDFGGVEWADGTEDGVYTPQGEEEEILFGPAEGIGVPDEEIGPTVTPASVLRRLPALARAAKDPTAPPSLVAMYRILTDRLDREMRR